MVNRGRILAAVSMAGVVMLGAGACGNDTDAKSESTPTTPTTLTTDTTGASNESADTTTTAVSGATDEVSGTGYYGGFSFELSESEVVVEEGVDAELSISVDVKNLRESGSQVFSPPVSIEDDAGTGVSGSADSDSIPGGSSGKATFVFSSSDGFDDLEGWTLLVGDSGEARVELPLDGSDQVSRTPVELEPSDAELSVDDVDITFVSLEAQWSDSDGYQVGKDEVAVMLEASATNNTDSQTCVRDAVSFVSPDGDTTAAYGVGDCEPAGESSKGLMFSAVIEQPEAGEWTLEVVGEWGTDGAEASGEVTFELTEEDLSGTMGSDSGEDESDTSGSSTTTAKDDEATSTTEGGEKSTTTEG